MSFGEIKNSVNSNLSEPLNFTNYMDDISIYGDKGYTMSFENKDIWQDMLTRSLSLFGYTAIHSIVYDRLTDEDVDIFISRNGKLGQCFNAFYQINDFNPGNIDAVLSRLTSAAFNKLELKLQAGIGRYINKRAEGDVGAWLYSIFEISSLKNYHTASSLLSDTAYLQGTVIPNTSLWMVVSIMSASITVLGNPTNPVYLNYIRVIGASTQTTLDFIEGIHAQGWLETFFNTQDVANVIAGSKEAIWGIAASPNGFEAMLSSTVTMQTIANNEVAVNALVDGFTVANKLQPIVARMKANSESLDADCSSITKDLEIMASVTHMKQVVTETLEDLNIVVSRCDSFVGNLLSCWTRKEFVEAIVGVPSNVDVIRASSDAKNICSLLMDSGHWMESVLSNVYGSNHNNPSATYLNVVGHTILVVSYTTGNNGAGTGSKISSPDYPATGSRNTTHSVGLLFRDFHLYPQFSGNSGITSTNMTINYIDFGPAPAV